MTKEKLEKVDEETKTSTEGEESTVKPPLETPKRSPLIMIVSIVVVAALIGTAFFVIVTGVKADNPRLEIIISPSTISIANGSSVRLYAYVTFKNSTDDPSPVNITNSVSVSIGIKWQINNPKLGDLNSGLTGTSKFWQFKSNLVGTSAINWSFKYRDPINRIDYFANKTTPVTIRVAELDYINILPPDRMMLINTNQNFTAESFLTNGLQVAASYTWSLDNSSLGNLSADAGTATRFTAGGLDMFKVNESELKGNLTCTGTYLDKSVTSKAPLTIIRAFPDEETHTSIYDVCAVPLKPYWADRYQEQVLSWTYPVAYSWKGTPAGNNWVYSNYRMNVSAKNITTANTYTNPVYMLITNPNPLYRGGNIKIDLISGYIDGNEVNRSKYSEMVSMYYDSWFFRTNGTITMDKVAAKMVLNITETELNNFNDWKDQKFPAFTTKLSNWLLFEMNTRLTIKFCYEWEGSTLFEKYDIEKIGDEVVLTIKDYLSYGFESLLGRWWRDTFLSFEGWPDEIHFTANIGPLWSDFTLSADMEYSLLAKTSTIGDQPVWAWETTHADSTTDSVIGYNSWQNPKTGEWINTTSELMPYKSTGYWNFLVANSYYDTIAPYDYLPWAWNLGVNDTWSIEWPSRADTKCYLNVGAGNYTTGAAGHIDPIWIEPFPGSIPNNMKINWSANRIDMNGPFDALNWSKDNGSREVRDNWSRTAMDSSGGSLLPRGIPYIEFGINTIAAVDHDPITIFSMPATTQYIKNSNHNYYAHYVDIDKDYTLISGGYDIGGTITNYTWDFGDGNFSYISSPTKHWTGADRDVNVTLTTKNDQGHSSNYTQRVNVTGNLPPTATFVLGDGTKSYGVLQTIFDASSSSDPNGHITLYEWDFGDGTNASLTTPIIAHQYAKMNNYMVSLKVWDDGTAKLPPRNTTYSFNVGIQTEVCAKIVMPDHAQVGTIVSLSGAKSFSFNGTNTIANFAWDFGDGTQGSGVSPTHTWTIPDTYTVTLQVKDSGGIWSPNATSRINIGTNTIAGLSLSIDRHSLFPSETTTLRISAVDEAGNPVPTSTSSIYVNASRSSYGWAGLPKTVNLVGGKASFVVSCSKTYSYNITANVSGDDSIIGYEHATIANRTVEITVYDLGQKQLGSVADIYTWKNYSRSQWSNSIHRDQYGDYPLRYEAMALQLYSTYTKIGSNVDTTDRVHAETRNLSEVNMANPTFFPHWLTNVSAGGHVSFTWDYHYLNLSEYWWWNANPSTDPIELPRNPYTFRQYDRDNWDLPLQYSMYTGGTYDGWETMQTISVTMDQSAAYQLLRMPSNHFTTDPIAWWDEIDWVNYESKNLTVKRLWEEGFMVNEGGSSSTAGRLDIKSCDDAYAWKMGYWGSIFRLTNNGDGTITMTINRVGYGEDTLLARWLYWGGVSSGWNYPNGTPKGIIPWEPYYDDFHMSGDINSQSANITLDAANIYAWRAQKSGDPNVPADTAVWRWEQIRIDYWESRSTNPRSEMDLWYNRTNMGATFDSWDPVGTAWGRFGYIADQSPNIVYLDVGESLIIERPRTIVSGILPVGFVGDISKPNDRTGSGYINWILINEKWGNATIHPLGCYPGTSVVDKGTGDLTIVGPFVPNIEYYTDPGLTWLWRNSAPLIEYWIQ